MGIKCNWYGKWYDIGSGEPVEIEKDKFISVEAVCGAFLLIRNRLLTEIKDRNGVIGFDSSYFMYKEDIELCQRISKHGFGVIVLNKYHAFPLSGWKKRVQYSIERKYSAINDLDLHLGIKKERYHML
jgi:GT2 family glycosyltransferase